MACCGWTWCAWLTAEVVCRLGISATASWRSPCSECVADASGVLLTVCAGSYLPTPTHHFLHLLHRKGLLLRVFTQNIDGLEQQAGLPADMVVPAHGSFDGKGSRWDDCWTRHRQHDGCGVCPAHNIWCM